MATKKIPVNAQKQLQLALFKSLIVPVLLLAFFMAAPHWLNYRLKDAFDRGVESNNNISPEEKQVRLAKIEQLDFAEICRENPPEYADLHDRLEKNGIGGNFQRLRWGLVVSGFLTVGLGLSTGILLMLNKRSRQSQADLIRNYRLGWAITVFAALVNVFLLIPLLAYGSFEFSVLMTDHYYPKLLIVIVLLGLIALWRSATILLKKVPMEFKEPMAQEVTPEEAPELWRVVRDAAEKLKTNPPDRIIVGLQLNFYVTELAVRLDKNIVRGRILYLSYPLLKQLSDQEVLAIIGHELGHFIGADTQLTREFYPLRWKIRATTVAMAGNLVGWPSFQFLNFFSWVFGQTEQAMSRERELLADRKAAELTSSQMAAQALLRFQIGMEAFKRGFKDSLKNPGQNLLDSPWALLVREKLANEEGFWTQLFEETLPHPLDSHPTLHIRLEALGHKFTTEQAKELAMTESASAYTSWFPNGETVFAGLAQQANKQIEKIRTRQLITEADYQSPEGKALLDQNFPEKKWQPAAGDGLVPQVLFILLAFGAGAVAMFAPDTSARVIFGLVSLFFFAVPIWRWKRFGKTWVTLNAGGLSHTGWKRPLLFKDVAKISGRRTYGTLTLTFHLKVKSPSIKKFSLLPIASKAVSYNVSASGKKPLDVAQTIFCYYTRQIEPVKGAETKATV